MLNHSLLLSWTFCLAYSHAFQVASSYHTQRQFPSSMIRGPRSDTHLFLFGDSSPRVPKSSQDRNKLVVDTVKKALASPRTPSYKLIECEFPAVDQLNKAGDGSLRSAQAVTAANLKTAQQLVSQLSFFGMGPKVWLLTSTAGARVAKAHSLKDGLPNVKGKDVCVLVAPSNSQDYDAAKRLVQNGNAVVLVNGFAKDPKSIPGQATMAYYLKPLTYNSQVAGYLTRTYPGAWTVLCGGKTLATYTDADILVPNTNTPDLRGAVRLVQKATDQRAIEARSK